MTIELYVFPPSPRAFKVMALASYLEIPYKLGMVDFRKGEQRSPAYAKLNPNMKMPTLVDGDFVLWESNAILQYLASLRPESGLLPRDERARIDVTRWQFWDLAHWDPACAVFVFEYVAKKIVLGIDKPDPTALEKGMEPFHRVAGVLEQQLTGKRYVTGDALTVADFSLGAAMTMAVPAHYPLERYGEIRRWYASLAAMPAWQRTLAQQQAA